jgi:signal transduction histidine kinase/ActR/RegA family two-component response regulator
MSTSSEVIRSESYEQLGQLILEHTDDLIRGWQQRAIEEQPAANRMHRSALCDHLPELLSAIARRLQAEGNVTSDAALLADRHGQQRWESGWSLSELLRDYQILRLVLLDFLEDALGRPLTAREAIAVGLELDDAIIESVNAFTRHSEQAIRDEAQRQADRDRMMREAIEEGLLREAEALKANDRRKNEFLALLGHELRNPLGAMSNAAALTQVLPPHEPDYQQAAGVLQRQLRQMERLVDDLLDISRIARGVFELKRQPIDLVAALRHAADTIRLSAEQRGQRLELFLPERPCYLLADPSRLEQIVVNLLVNAVKYTPSGGQIVCAVEAADDRVRLRVADNGIGIAPELLPHVFDMFMRAEQAAQRSEGGLGLGLTLVRNLVEMHGWTIEAASDGPDLGSEFVVEMPLAADLAEEGPSPADAQQPKGQARVLVVDDNHDVALTLAALVRYSGHDVRTAHDGPAALELARSYRPDLVLSDIGLPGMDGYEVARRMRDELRLVDAVLAALTGYGQEEDRRRSEAAGFDRHIVKPIRTETLVSLLSAASRPH